MLKLEDRYRQEVKPVMQEKFGYKNKMAVPRIEKVVINTSFGKLIAEKGADEQKKIYEAILQDVTTIAGQYPVLTRAKKSIASFKLRKGMPVGARVTLRKQKMYDFLSRLINVGLPRSRDFRGIDRKSFDKFGNLTVSIKEHIAFPEISPEKARNIFGFEITVVTTAETREEGIELLKLMGFPIKN